MTENKQPTTLYEHYKNSPKKLKIVCDWDEVIQACEPYALWKAWKSGEDKEPVFFSFYKLFWWEENMKYFPYGSGLKEENFDKEKVRKYWEMANLSDFYHQVPFLTIAEDLLRLIKEDKIEKLIFLSTGDSRKREVFEKIFAKLSKSQTAENKLDEILSKNTAFIVYRKDAELVEKTKRAQFLINSTIVDLNENDKSELRQAMIEALEGNIQLHLMSDYPEIRTKADWIKKFAPRFDIFIDDNPFICRSILEAQQDWGMLTVEDKEGNVEPIGEASEKYVQEYIKEKGLNFPHPHLSRIKVIAPYYPAIESQHDERVLLVKQEVVKIEKWEK